MTGQDLVTQALTEIQVYQQGQSISASDATLALQRANWILDEWSAREVYAYNVNFAQFTLVPDLSPHTIGPSGATFTVTQRPQRIEGCTIILNNNPSQPTDCPVNIQNDQWWLYQRLKNLQSNIPTDLYYSPDFPNGSLYFWPVPNYAYGVRLEVWVVMAQIAALNTVINPPPAYARALMLALAEDLAAPFGGVWSDQQAKKLMLAKKALMANNDESPRVTLDGLGLPGGNGRSGYFNWLSGDVVDH